jgi:hypothetical protein
MRETFSPSCLYPSFSVRLFLYNFRNFFLSAFGSWREVLQIVAENERKTEQVFGQENRQFSDRKNDRFSGEKTDSFF